MVVATDSKYRNLLVVVFLVAILLGVGILFSGSRDRDEGVACTMEAKLCPDGSAVGRTGPNCEFAECPGETVDTGNGIGGSIIPHTSGIRGVVLRGPLCPVVREGEECPDAPYATSVYVRRSESSNSAPLATTKSGTDGTFEFSLPPGMYEVNATNEGISKTCSLALVLVEPEQIENVVLSCDTGIR